MRTQIDGRNLHFQHKAEKMQKVTNLVQNLAKKHTFFKFAPDLTGFLFYSSVILSSATFMMISKTLYCKYYSRYTRV